MTRSLYLDASSGLSGNMLIAALLDSGLDFDPWRDQLKLLNLEHYHIAFQAVDKIGVRAMHLRVESHEPQPRRRLKEIEAVISKSGLSRRIQDKAVLIFRNLALAEAEVHDCTMDQVHFHEVGAIDAIVDVVGCVIAVEMLGIEKIICSPIRVGSGFIKMTHGLMPIPAPATALILKDIPTYAGDEAGEFTTPTGAAIIKTLCGEFRSQPVMKIQRIGVGAGTRDHHRPNILRAFLGKDRPPKRRNKCD